VGLNAGLLHEQCGSGCIRSAMIICDASLRDKVNTVSGRQGIDPPDSHAARAAGTKDDVALGRNESGKALP